MAQPNLQLHEFIWIWKYVFSLCCVITHIDILLTMTQNHRKHPRFGEGREQKGREIFTTVAAWMKYWCIRKELHMILNVIFITACRYVYAVSYKERKVKLRNHYFIYFLKSFSFLAPINQEKSFLRKFQNLIAMFLNIKSKCKRNFKSKVLNENFVICYSAMKFQVWFV